jgi:SagB-type dehydrogenase family enzyme
VSGLQSIARLASAVYAEPPPLDDPAELYHEASKLVPSTAPRAVAGAARLAASPELRRAAARASFRHPELPLLPLGGAQALSEPLGSVLARRRSARTFGPGSITAAQLASLLEAGYGVTGSVADEGGWTQPLRAAPSGGALYPLDLYLEPRRVEGLEPGVYRFDPLERALEALGPACASISEATAYPELAEAAAVTVVLAATFWRSRFKYGLRSYRFTLLEAGHVAQNLLLAATAVGLASVPLGGFYDRRLDEALGLDGVDRSCLYLVCVGPGGDAC